MADIRIVDLPLATGPTAPASTDAVAIDGLSTRKAPLSGLADAIRPIASQAEAEAGSNSVKGMSPLTTAQAIAALGSTQFASYAQGITADSALQPSAVGVTVASYAQGLKADTAMQPAIYDPTGKSVSPFLSANIDVPNADSGGATISVFDALIGVKTISNYGGTRNAAVAAMAAAFGFVVFPTGSTTLNSITIAVPVYFQTGAYITAASGQTVTITNRINSDRQYIFQGPGSYKLNIASVVGEDVRMVHVSWFGIFPQNGGAGTIIQDSLINKMFSSFSQGREGIIDWDSGSYHITWDALDPIPRGVWMRGAGIRRTTFDMNGSSTSTSKLFKTGGPAGKITGIQFEDPEGTSVIHPGTAISLDHDDWVVEDIRTWNTQFGVVMNGLRNEARNIQAIYAQTPLADSATVRVNNDGCVVDDIRVRDTSFGPGCVVQIGMPNNLRTTLRQARVSNVRTNEYTIPVQIYADGNVNIQGVVIDNVTQQGLEAQTVIAAVHLITRGAGSINLVTIDGVLCNSTAATLITFDQGSTEFIRDVTFGGSVAIGSGVGIDLIQTAGSLTDITIADGVDVSDRATKVRRSGTMSEIRLGKSVTMVWTALVADDTAVTVPVPELGGIAFISPMGGDGTFAWMGGALMCAYRIRNGTTHCIKMSANPLVATVNTDVTGTTGVDGQVTAGVTTAGLRVENRTGASQIFRVTFEP